METIRSKVLKQIRSLFLSSTESHANCLQSCGRSYLRLTILTTLIVLGGVSCSKNSGEEQRTNVPRETDETEEFSYRGSEQPATEDVQNFLNAVWKRLAPDNRCGACHYEGDQEPYFTHKSNINEAYAEANKLVDFETPGQSLLVTKVAEGHNCWRAESALCEDAITKYIEAWASASGAVSNEIEFVEPQDSEVGASKSFPDDPTSFGALIHQPYLVKYCSECHAEDAPTPQQPYFASNDLDAAYAAVRNKINIDVPNLSRLVVRLEKEFHHCWAEGDEQGGNCPRSASAMNAAVSSWVAGVPETEINPDLLVSKALTFSGGMVVSAGGRIESDVIALYEFKQPNPDIAFDTSDVEPPLNLNLIDGVNKLDSWGIRITDGKAQGATSASAKLQKLIKATGQYSIEAWVVPANVSQEGPARIVSYSGGNDIRNFTLGQTLYNYDFLNRSSATNANGMMTVSTPTADEVLQATLQHVVVTYDSITGRKIFVNGENVVDEDPAGGGNIDDWDDSFALVLGRETSGDYLWQGSIRLLAIHNRALELEHIQANYDVGVGEKRYLLFDVSEHVDMPQAYIGMRAQLFDDYSYLFDAPFFISLDKSATPTSTIDIRGIRIGMNGRETTLGQAFARLDTKVDSSNYLNTGTLLSRLGTLVPKDKGIDADQFFLTFDHIGGASFARPAIATPVAVPAQDAELPSPDIGLRTFAEINHTLSAMTGVPMTEPAVMETFEAVKQQLPTVETIDGFLAAHQMGITQLAVKYCNTLVNDTDQRARFFGDFNFTAPANSAFDVVGRDKVIQPLQQALVAHRVAISPTQTDSLSSQPDPAVMELELNNLIDSMTACGVNCSANTTPNTVTAVCAAALGSAVMLIQ